jgi:hypothetical protein
MFSAGTGDQEVLIIENVTPAWKLLAGANVFNASLISLIGIYSALTVTTEVTLLLFQNLCT